ncbi:MAG: hypothetical protein ABEJ95_03490 [Candidatus Nanohalobium sp.]
MANLKEAAITVIAAGLLGIFGLSFAVGGANSDNNILMLIGIFMLGTGYYYWHN